MAAPLDRPARETIDAVIFDAGGVLVLPDAERGRAAVRKLNCESCPEDWRRAYYLANIALDGMDKPDWPAVRKVVASAVGVPVSQLDAAVPLIEELFVSAPWVPVDGATDVLQKLAGAGYQLAVVSNAFGTVAQQLEDLRICSLTADGSPRVGAIIDSRLVGVEKPDPRIFHLALDALGVEPSRSAYIGDTVKFDVRGAQAAGLYALHLDPFGSCAGAHSHLSCLADLSDWLIPI